MCISFEYSNIFEYPMRIFEYQFRHSLTSLDNTCSWELNIYEKDDFHSQLRPNVIKFFSTFIHQKRRAAMQQRPNLPLSLVLAGRGFVMGVCLGLSGIVLDPIRGNVDFYILLICKYYFDTIDWCMVMHFKIFKAR